MKKITQDECVLCDEVAMPHIADGEYEAVYKCHEVFVMYGGAQKLRTMFQIADQSEYSGVLVPKFWSIKIVNKKNGSWSAGSRSAFARDFCSLFPDFNPRKERVSMSRLKGKLVSIRVVTVDKDRAGRPIPEYLRYSKIKEITHVG